MGSERVLICAGVSHAVRKTPLLHAAHGPALDLHGEDLRGRDLRSLDLENADLRGADLRDVRTGLSFGRRTLLALLCTIGSVALGALAGFAGQRLGVLIVSPSKLYRFVGLAMAAELCLFLIVALLAGLSLALRRVLAPTCAGALTLGLLGILAGGTGAAASALLAFSALLFTVIALSSLVRAVAHSTGLWFLLLVALSGAVASSLLHGGIAASALALAALVLGRRARHDDPELPYLSRWSRRVASAAGTNLRNADLRGACLQGCTLTCTDLRGAKLEGAVLSGVCTVMCCVDPEQQTLLTASRSQPDSRLRPSPNG